MSCFCGDTLCPSCHPGAAEAEAAEEHALETLAKAGLTPEEYRIVVGVGLAAVAQARKAVKQVHQIQRQNAAEDEDQRSALLDSALLVCQALSNNCYMSAREYALVTLARARELNLKV